MTFQDAFATCMKKYADFSGRAVRSEYWWFALALFLIYMAAIIVSETLYWVAILAFFLPSLSVAVRRLHDIGKSGWWYLIAFIPIIGAIVLLYWFVQPSVQTINEYGEPASI